MVHRLGALGPADDRGRPKKGWCWMLLNFPDLLRGAIEPRHDGDQVNLRYRISSTTNQRPTAFLRGPVPGLRIAFGVHEVNSESYGTVVSWKGGGRMANLPGERDSTANASPHPVTTYGAPDPEALAGILCNAEIPMMIADARQPEFPILFANRAMEILTGYGAHELIGRNCLFLRGNDTDPQAIDRIQETLTARRAIQIDLLMYRRDNSAFWNRMQFSPVRGADGEVSFIFITQQQADPQTRTEGMLHQRVADLEAELEEKTLLLAEVEHRVKNNLAMIGALIRLQARAAGDQVLKDRLSAMLKRIDALTTVHRRLHQSQDARQFDAGAFAADLAHDVLGASGRNNIKLHADLQTVMLPSSAAVALGLILNELLTNAVKHAFKDGRAGNIDLSVQSDGAFARICVSDDGPGMSPNSNPGGFGQLLIRRLARHSGATIEHVPSELGARFILRFRRAHPPSR